MSGIILLGNGLSSSIKISNENAYVIRSKACYRLQEIKTNSNFANVAELDCLEVSHNHTLIIEESTAPLKILRVFGSNVTWNNSYTGPVKTSITLGQDSKVEQLGQNLPIEKVSLSTNSAFKFTYDNISYEVKNLETDHNIIKNFDNLDTIVEVAKTLEAKSVSDSKLNDLAIVKKLQQIDKNQLNMFIEQNNIKCKDVIENALFNLIKHLSNSVPQPLFADEIIQEISSYLEFEDIILTGEIA